MKMQFSKLVGLVLAVGVIAGCASSGVKRTEKVESSFAQTRKNLEQANQQVGDVLVLLRGLQLEKFAVEPSYEKLKKYSKSINDAVARLQKNTKAVEAAGKTRFETWNQELSLIQNEEIKKQSEAQLAEAKAKFNKLLEVMRKSEAVLTPFASDLNDIVKYLELDLSTDSVKKLAGPIQKAEKSGRAVQEWVAEVVKDIAEAEKARIPQQQATSAEKK